LAYFNQDFIRAATSVVRSLLSRLEALLTAIAVCNQTYYSGKKDDMRLYFRI